MAYTELGFTDTPGVTSGGLSASNEFNADRGNYMEDGIAAAAATADAALAAATGASETMDNAAAGSVFYKVCSSGVWPARGSTRTDILVLWVGTAATDPAPPLLTGSDDRELKVT